MGKYYIAYGSNINQTQMKQRCPTATVVGTSVLKDYRLVFRGSHERGVATIEPEAGSTVPVLVWTVEDRDEQALDWYEGWPTLYWKEDITIDLDGKDVGAFVYVMNTEGHPYEYPDAYYYGVIRAGYKEIGFDTAALSRASRETKKH